MNYQKKKFFLIISHVQFDNQEQTHPKGDPVVDEETVDNGQGLLHNSAQSLSSTPCKEHSDTEEDIPELPKRKHKKRHQINTHVHGKSMSGNLHDSLAKHIVERKGL